MTQQMCEEVSHTFNTEERSLTEPDSAPDDIATRLILIWQQLLSLEPITPEQNYFDLGGDSSLAVQMFAQIHEIFKIKLPLATLYEAPTVNELAAVLRSEVRESRWSPLVAVQASGSRLPFFCMHGAGGNVLNYRELSKHLGPDQPFYGLQCSGLDGSCPPLTKIEDMAALYAAEIRRIRPRGPYLIGGYCMGGTIAYEVAQQLTAQNETVALLALFDTVNWNKIPLTTWSKLSYMCQKWWFHLAAFLQLDSDGKSKFLKEKMLSLRHRLPVWKGMMLSRFGKRTGHDASEALLLAEIWTTNDRAGWTYVPKPYTGKVTDYRPKRQYRTFNRPGVKWEHLARGGQEIVLLPVYPGSMLVEPFVNHLAAALNQSLEAAIAAESQPVGSR